jgi:hypothetical protein
VDITVICRRMHEMLTLKDDVRVVTAIARRLDNTMAREMGDLTKIRAEYRRMDPLPDRLRALETPESLER